MVTPTDEASNMNTATRTTGNRIDRLRSTLYNFVATKEGYRSIAYRDSGGVPTIGYGHTRGVKMGDHCTHAQALEWLEVDMHQALTAIQGAVKVPLTQYQFDALGSFTFNVGATNVHTKHHASVLNKNDMEGASHEFPRWCHVHGQFVEGLFERRIEEMRIFRNEKVPPAYANGTLPGGAPHH